MTQPYLMLRYRSSAHSNSIVLKDYDRQLVQIGQAIPAEESTTAISHRAFNRVVHWNNDLYCMLDNAIWRYRPSNGLGWQNFYDFSGSVYSVIPNHRMGLYPCSVNGTGLLVTAYPTAGDSCRFITIDRDGGVSESATKTAPVFDFNADNFTPFGPAVAWKNSIVWLTISTTSHISIYDLETEILSQSDDDWDADEVSNDALERAYTNPVVFNNNVFCVFKRNSQPRLGRLEGKVFSDVGLVDSQTIATNQAPQYALVPLKNSLYYVGLEISGADGWIAREIILDSNNRLSSSINRDSTLPTELREGGDFAQLGSSDGMMYPRIDLITNGIDSPIYEFDFVGLDDENETRRLYRWDGDMSGTWNFVAAGADPFRHSFIVDVVGDTETTWSASGTLNASPPTLSLNGTNVVCSFRIYGDDIDSPVKAQVYYADDGGVLNTKGKIRKVSHGVLNNDTVEGLLADNTTEYSIEWAAALDGVTNIDTVRVSIRVFV